VIDRLLRSPRFVVGAVFISLALTGLVIGYATGGGEASSSLPSAPAASQTYLRGAVQSVDNDQVTLTTDAGTRTLKLAPSVAVETLKPIDAASIARGDWLNGGAVRNSQTVFAITSLVVIRQALLGTVSP